MKDSIKYDHNSYICLFYFSASACSFRGLMANCPMTIGGHHIDASARINKCHTPIDIYFLITANNDRNPSAHNTDNTVSTKWKLKILCKQTADCFKTMYLFDFSSWDIVLYIGITLMLPVTIQKWEKCQVMDKESNFMSMQTLEMKEVNININQSSVIYSKLSFV